MFAIFTDKMLICVIYFNLKVEGSSASIPSTASEVPRKESCENRISTDASSVQTIPTPIDARNTIGLPQNNNQTVLESTINARKTMVVTTTIAKKAQALEQRLAFQLLAFSLQSIFYAFDTFH